MKGKVGSYLAFCLLLSVAYFYWDQLNEKFQLTYAHRSLTDVQGNEQFKNVMVYKNGFSTGGVQMQVSADIVSKKNGRELAEYFSQFVEVETIKTEDSKAVTAVADRVYNGNGVLLQSYDEIKNDDRLYLVAPGLLFVWPFVKLGHRVYLTPKESPLDKPVILESLTESPRTFHVHNFFTNEEADELTRRILEIDDEHNKLQQSHVGHQNGKKLVSPHRTSENAFDQVSATAVTIRKRVFEVLSIEKYQDDMCDGLQLLRYKQKQAYIAHTDYFDKHTTSEWNWDPSTGGSNRFATMFMYLSNVTRGGQTVFPEAPMPEGIPDEYNHPADVADYQARGLELFDKDSWEYDMVKKCSTRLAAYPRKTHAVLFYSQKPNGELDPMSLHGGCPVLDGTKWGANLWVWNKRRYGLDDAGTTNSKFSVVFQNPTQHTVEVFWSSTLMTTLDPGNKKLYQTYNDHKWTIKSKSGRVLLEFAGKAEDGDTQTVVIPVDSFKDEL
ncbi:TPA: hypothetical protein N0F65_001076 [Lagenidium giganteum]|uniref:Fe2OG dioxygenase domain-containing protein n=1 Tax=Lagenidium giganteum TaxID=4803 RepID=A0AAV2YJY5_9STRA|nr:TPA: hypothetical protein N0F65_001076 [Lagenidium giganteum]